MIKDELLTRAHDDAAKHNNVALSRDLHDILLRDTDSRRFSNVDQSDSKAVAAEVDRRIREDLNHLRNLGISERTLKDAGFPSSEHLIRMMDTIGADEKSSIRKDMPGVKLTETERKYVAQMDRAILTGDAERLSDLTSYFGDKPQEFEKIARVVAHDVQEVTANIAVHKSRQGIGFDVKIVGSDNSRFSYNASATGPEYIDFADGKTGAHRHLNSADQGFDHNREELGVEASKWASR